MLKNADFLSAMAKIAAFFVGQLRSSVPNETVDLADRAGDWTKSGKVLHWTRFAIGLLPPVIEGVMSEIEFCDERQAYAALSLLLDESTNRKLRSALPHPVACVERGSLTRTFGGFR